MDEFGTRFWAALWTEIWVLGLSVFSILSVLVIVFGGSDLAALLRSLAIRHQQAQAEAGRPPRSPLDSPQ